MAKINKQTDQVIDFIDNYKKEDVMNFLVDIPFQAYIEGGNKLSKYIWSILLDDVKDCYPIMTDFVTHCLSLVDWTHVAKVYMDQ